MVFSIFLGEVNLCSCTKNVTSFWSISGSHINLITPTNVGFLIGTPFETRKFTKQKISFAFEDQIFVTKNYQVNLNEETKQKSCLQQNCSRWVLLHKKDALESLLRDEASNDESALLQFQGMIIVVKMIHS